MAEYKFSEEEKKKMLRDIWEFLKKDVSYLYRIWIEESKKEKILEKFKERKKIGVLQYELLSHSEFFKNFYLSILSLSRNPHTEIYSEKGLYPLNQIDEVDSDVLFSYINVLNGESTKLLAIMKNLTSDTYENRAIKGILIKLIRDINYLIQDLEEIKDKRQKYSREIKEMIDKIRDKRKRISFLLNLDFLKEISPEFELKPTPIFMFNPIYSRIYKLWQTYLSFYLPFEANELGVGLIAEWQLYELWVFVTIFNFIKSKLKEPIEIKGFFEEEKGRIKLKIGEIEGEENLSFSLKWKNNWELWYQKYIPGIVDDAESERESEKRHYQKYIPVNEDIVSYTLPVIPDILLWNKNNNDIFIFDVKKMTLEEIKRGKKYEEERRTVVSQLHQYKDAIIENKTRKKVVKKAFAIIPERGESIEDYNKFFKDWYRKKYGFGFLVFEPYPNGKIENICDYVFEKGGL